MSRNFSTGGEWILIHRQKTGTEANIKLLDYPKQIMEKYRGLCEDGRVFPVPIYKSCMRALERLGKEMWHNQASHLALLESQQNLLLIECQYVRFFKECNC